MIFLFNDSEVYITVAVAILNRSAYIKEQEPFSQYFAHNESNINWPCEFSSEVFNEHVIISFIIPSLPGPFLNFKELMYFI